MHQAHDQRGQYSLCQSEEEVDQRRSRDILYWTCKVRCRAKLLKREKTAKWTFEAGATILNGYVEVELYSYLDQDGNLLNPPFSLLFLFLAIFLGYAS